MQPTEVLMVEDNRGDVILLQEAVAKVGFPYRFNIVQDGVEAVDYLRRQGKWVGAPRPDLIVLDIKLPRKSGLEVLDDIRSNPALSAIPVVVLSSSRSDIQIAQSGTRSQECCIVKPNTFAGYVDLIHTIAAFRQARLAPARAAGGGIPDSLS